VRGKAVNVTCPNCKKPFAVRTAAADAAGDAPAKAKPQRSRTPVVVDERTTKAGGQRAKSRPQRSRTPARAKEDVAFDEDSPRRRSVPVKSSGRGLLWLLVGGAGAVVVLAAAACAVVYVMFFLRPGESKPIVQAPQINIEQQPTPEIPIRKEPAVETPKEPVPKTEPDPKKVPPPEEKKPPEEPRPEKPPPEIKPPPVPPKPPVEVPPAKPAKVPLVNKTRDGAMTLTTHPDKNLRFTAVSPDGKILYTAAWDNQLRSWDTETFDLKEEVDLPKPDKQPNSRLQAALTPDGKSVVFAHWDILQIMDLKSQKVDVFEGMPNEEHSLGQIVLSRDGKVALTRWATVSYAGWRVTDRKFVTKLTYDGMGLARNNASVLGADGSSWVHTAANTNAIHLRALPTLRDLGTLTVPEAGGPGDTSSYSAPVLSPKGRYLAAGRFRRGAGSVRVFDLNTRALIRDLPVKKYSKDLLDPEVNSIAISPDEKLLVAMDSHRWVHGYDLVKGTFLGAFAFPKPGAWSNGGDDERTVQFTKDGRYLVAAGLNLVKVWERDKLVWPDPTDPANQPEEVAGKKPEKPVEKPKEPEDGEYKDAVFKEQNEMDYYFEVGGRVIRATAQPDTVWLDPDGKKVGKGEPRFILLRNKGNTVRFKIRRVEGQAQALLVEVQAVKLIAEYELREGSVELKGARVSKVQMPHVWLTDKDGKEHHTVVLYSTFVKDAEGKDVEQDNRFKVLKVGAVVDAVVSAPVDKKSDHVHLLFARPVKE
jgi:WD40 repeat protein